MIKTESMISGRRCYQTWEGYGHLQRAANVGERGSKTVEGEWESKDGPHQCIVSSAEWHALLPGTKRQPVSFCLVKGMRYGH